MWQLFTDSQEFGTIDYVQMIPHVQCDRCQLTRQARISFPVEKRRHIRVFEQYALELAQITTALPAADHLNVAWDMARDLEVLHRKK